jgi:hypothetical protein
MPWHRCAKALKFAVTFALARAQKKCHPQVAFFFQLKLDYSALVPLLVA